MTPNKSRGSELSVFRGKAAKLNRAIFQVLSAEETMAVWDIFKCVTKFRGLKRKRYAVIDVRVKALEAEGYLEVAGERETKQGNKTPLFKLTAKGKVALAIGPRTIDDVFRELNEETVLALLKTISKLSTFSQFINCLLPLDKTGGKYRWTQKKGNCLSHGHYA